MARKKDLLSGLAKQITKDDNVVRRERVARLFRQGGQQTATFEPAPPEERASFPFISGLEQPQGATQPFAPPIQPQETPPIEPQPEEVTLPWYKQIPSTVSNIVDKWNKGGAIAFTRFLGGKAEPGEWELTAGTHPGDLTTEELAAIGLPEDWYGLPLTDFKRYKQITTEQPEAIEKFRELAGEKDDAFKERATVDYEASFSPNQKRAIETSFELILWFTASGSFFKSPEGLAVNSVMNKAFLRIFNKPISAFLKWKTGKTLLQTQNLANMRAAYNAGITQGKLAFKTPEGRLETFKVLEKYLEKSPYDASAFLAGYGQSDIAFIRQLEAVSATLRGMSGFNEEMFRQVNKSPLLLGGLPAGYKMTPQKWEAMAISARSVLVESLGLTRTVASKAWEALSEAERAVLAQPPVAEVPEVALETDIVTSLSRAFQIADGNAQLGRQFIENNVIPAFNERFGDAPVMSIVNIGDERLLQISEGGWRQRAEESGLEFVRKRGNQGDLYRIPQAAIPKAEVAPTPQAAPEAVRPPGEVVTPEIAPTPPTAEVVPPVVEELEGLKRANPALFRRAEKASNTEDFIDSVIKAGKTTRDKVSIPALTNFFNRVKGVKPLAVKPTAVAPGPVTPTKIALEAIASREAEVGVTDRIIDSLVASEDTAVAEVAGAPPKPPKDFDRIGGQLYDRFRKQGGEPTPNTTPVSARLQRARGKVEKFGADEFARLNKLGWETEIDVAFVRASKGIAGQLYRETMDGIAKTLGGKSELLSYVDDYLLLRHQLEVLKATDRTHFTIKKGDITQKFTAKQIGLIFRQMKQELGVEDYARVKEASSSVVAVYNQTLRDTQELTPEQIEGLITKYPWYNPVLFKAETAPININARRLTARQIKQLTNLEADKEQISPLQTLPTTIAGRIKANLINDARKSISEGAADPKNSSLIGGETEIVDKKPTGLFIDYFDKGQRKYLKLGKGTEWIAEDIELLQRQPINVTTQIVRQLQNISKMFFTTYNPGFVVYNTVFDAVTSYFTEGVSPAKFGRTLAGNIKSIFTDVPAVSEFRRAGGELFGFFERGSREGLGFGEKEKAITSFVAREKETGRIVLRNPNSLKRLLNPLNLIREMGIAGENAARRATFEMLQEKGLPRKEAVIRDWRVTVDFGRFSQSSRFINDWFIYFNPAMQGFLLPGRAIKKNPQSLWRLGTLIAGYIGLTLYNQSYDEYKDVRDSDKVGKLVIMLPSNEYNKHGQKVPHYITLLPLREFAAFTAPIEYLIGKMKAEDPEAYRTLAQEWGVLYPVLSPLSMISESGGLVMPTQIGATIQQITQNHDDFRDRPIVDDEMMLLPASQQYDQFTNSLAIRIGQALDISPKKLDFFVSNMFGALGNDVLRAVDVVIQQIDVEVTDERIAGLVNELRAIQTKVPPNQIAVARETFLEDLSAEDRQVVLDTERIPADKFPFIQSLVRRFFKNYGGQVFATAKEKALANRDIEDYPPEALEKLQEDALANANSFLSGGISKQEYDRNRTRYRAYFSGASTAQWREAMTEGAVARADVDKFLPEAYQRSEEFQAVSAYMEIRQTHIDAKGGVLNSEIWAEIEANTLDDMKRHYSANAIQYALDHKDDWIDKLPEPARTLERDRAIAIDNETWWEDYREVTPEEGRTAPRQTQREKVEGLFTPPPDTGQVQGGVGPKTKEDKVADLFR